jgi:tetratricopeptide (TPR) repeat protein
LSRAAYLKALVWLCLLALAVGSLAQAALGVRGLSAAGRLLDQAEGNVALRATYASQALTELEALAQRSPGDIAVHRQIGRAALLLGRPERAVSAFEQALRLAPDSPLVREELARAYTIAGDAAAGEQLWGQIGVTPQETVLLAERLMERDDYGAAMDMYRLAVGRTPELQDNVLFRQLLSAAWSGEVDRALFDHARDQGHLVRIAGDGAWVEGAFFRWMTPVPQYGVQLGTPLNHPRGTSEGIFWWSGEAAALVEIEEPGQYQIELRLCHCRPAPVEMRVGVNREVLASFALARDDNSYGRVVLQVYLERGLNTVHLWFDNNEIVNGDDRDAVLTGMAVRPTAQR